MIKLCSDITPSNNGVMAQQGSSKKKKHSKKGTKVSGSARLAISEIVSKEKSQETIIKMDLNENKISDKVQERGEQEEKSFNKQTEGVKMNEVNQKNDNIKSAIMLINKNNQLEEIERQEIISDIHPQISTISNNNLTKSQEQCVQILSENQLFQNYSPISSPSISIADSLQESDNQNHDLINSVTINQENNTKQSNNQTEQTKPNGDINTQDIFQTPEKTQTKNHPHPQSISNNLKTQNKPYLNSSSVSSVSTSSSSSSQQQWRHPAACPQKQTEEINREYRAEDRLHMLTQILPRNEQQIDSYLDLGCGNCEISAKIASHFSVNQLFACDVYPVENSQRPLGLPSYVKFEYFANENNTFTGIQDSSLDLITCFMVLHHIEEIRTNLLELKRITKEGGYLYIREHDVPTHDTQLDKYLREKHNDFHDGGVLFMNFFSKIQLKKMLGKYNFRHVADSMYKDSRPNRQKVYHSLFVKDSSLSESNSSEESTEESDRSSSITVSRFSEQDGEEQENAKFPREDTKKLEKDINFFGRTLFQNQSRDGSPTTELHGPISLNRKNQSDSYKYTHQRQIQPTQLVWRNSCSNQSQVQNGQKAESQNKPKKHFQQHWKDNQRINNYDQTQEESNWKKNRFSRQDQFQDLHKAKKLSISKMQDELDFEDEEREKKYNKKEKEIIRHILCSQHLPVNKQTLKNKEVKPVQLIDILS